MEYIGIIVILLTLALIIGTIAYYLSLRKQIKLLSNMIQSAMNGEWQEDCYDESQISALSAQLSQFLSMNRLYKENLSEDQRRIKELIGDISHQTKTPISNILMYTQLLQEEELPEEVQPLVGQIAGQSEKLNFLIQSLVKTSRLESGVVQVKPEERPISELFDGLYQEYSSLAEAKNQTLLLEPSQLTAKYDLKWTLEAIGNLVDNAIKYTPTDGKIIITATGYELFCKIDVRDTGIGIAESEHTKVFQRFYRSEATKNEKGVGIGLYLARQIASAQAGYIKVSSKIGQGSTFSFFVPR